MVLFVQSYLARKVEWQIDTCGIGRGRNNVRSSYPGGGTRKVRSILSLLLLVFIGARESKSKLDGCVKVKFRPWT